MEIYLVGGAVRDALLGLPVKDRDWVVVGATPQQMIDQGFRPVGKDFPVFLHPDTHEEYALARTERKIARGYHGFEFNADPGVTLAEDLSRRDLTINAIAQTPDGRYVDPFNGRADIEARCLRHVSAAFVEDPVRVLRIARFAARFAPMGFDIAAETQALMRRMVAAGETQSLVAERVWQEMQRALASESPRTFIETLRTCGALHDVLPEIDRLFGVPQAAPGHPPIDVAEHTLRSLQAAALSESTAVRFAALCHDIGKGLTPQASLPRHPLHAKRGATLLPPLCERLRIPRDIQSLAVLAARWHSVADRASALRPAALLQLLLALDALRRPERFDAFLQVCEANHRARPGVDSGCYAPAHYLREMHSVLARIDTGAIARQSADKTRLIARIRQTRIDALTAAIGTYKSANSTASVGTERQTPAEPGQ